MFVHLPSVNRFYFAVVALPFVASSSFAQVTGYLDYNPASGSLAFVDLAGDDPVTTMKIVSVDGVFTGTRPEASTPFDLFDKHRFFTITPNGLKAETFGPLMARGLNPNDLANDLCLEGTRTDPGAEGISHLGNIALRAGNGTWPLQIGNCPAVPVVPNVMPDSTISYLDYDPETGTLTFDDRRADDPVTTIEIVSKQGVFTGARPSASTLFDIYEKHRFFTITPFGLKPDQFGPLMATGLDAEVLASDLCLDGSRTQANRGADSALGNVDLRVGDGTWPIQIAQCPAVPHVPRVTIDPIDFYLDYDPATGALSVDSTSQRLNAIVLRTVQTPLFTGNAPDLVDDRDPLRETLIFEPRLFSFGDVKGYDTLDVGPIVPADADPKWLASVLCYRARTAEGGETGPLYLRTGGEIFPVSCDYKVQAAQVTPDVLDDIVSDDVDVGVVVEPDSGTLIVHVPEIPDGASKPLTRITIESDSPIFVPGAQLSGVLDGPFDILTEQRLLKKDSTGFSTVNFGPILRPDVEISEIERALHVSGSFLGGGLVQNSQVADLRSVPEPSAAGLVLVTAFLLLFSRRTSNRLSRR
ncbi:MAG: hypothetical protein KDB27_31015 [Planctomycetales bacterium]|nr:hypothetical protein [Planctomycetales bacterium]